MMHYSFLQRVAADYQIVALRMINTFNALPEQKRAATRRRRRLQK
jgi:hypothetical protein